MPSSRAAACSSPRRAGSYASRRLGKRGPSSSSFGPARTFSAAEVDVVRDQHQLARADLGPQGARRVGQHQDLGAGAVERAHGRAQLIEVAALVEVRSALQQRHRDATELAQHHMAAVTLDRGPRKARQLLVGHLDRLADGLGDHAETRAEHDADARACAAAALQDPRRLAPAHGASRSKASGSSSPSVVDWRGPPGRPRCTGIIRTAELGQALAAAATRRADVHPLGGHGHRGDAGLAGGHHRADGRGLRTLALRIGGVLDVGAGEDAAARAPQRDAHLEVRVRRVGVLHRLGGSAQEQLRRVEQQVGVALADERLVADLELLAKPGNLGMLRRQVGCAGAHRLELEEAAEPLDLVEVDANVVEQEQPAALRHYHERAERRVERLAQLRSGGDRNAPVAARAGARLVGAPVLDQLVLAGLLLTQLEPSTRA